MSTEHLLRATLAEPAVRGLPAHRSVQLADVQGRPPWRLRRHPRPQPGIDDPPEPDTRAAAALGVLAAAIAADATPDRPPSAYPDADPDADDLREPTSRAREILTDLGVARDAAAITTSLLATEPAARHPRAERPEEALPGSRHEP